MPWSSYIIPFYFTTQGEEPLIEIVSSLHEYKCNFRVQLRLLLRRSDSLTPLEEQGGITAQEGLLLGCSG